MKLPNASQARVDREKIVDYLLNPAHPDNSGKAEFFQSLGFQSVDWKVLADAFRILAGRAEVLRSVTSPRGKSAQVQTIWIVDSGSEVARLVTAYPHEG